MNTPVPPPDDAPPVRPPRVVARAVRLFRALDAGGPGRDRAGNRRLRYSHYAALVLLGLFNPAMRTLRGIQAASDLRAVRRRLGCGRTSLGSLSESARVFDPDLLVPLVRRLLARHRVHGPGPRRTVPDGIPPDLARKLVAADGSAIRALGKMVRCKLHLQFHVLTGVPAGAAMTGGEADERDVLADHLKPGHVYIADRGYERYALYNRVVAAGSDYVIRGQARAAAVARTRPLSADATRAGVTEDADVRLNVGASRPTTAVVDHPVRRVTIARREHGRCRTNRPQHDDVIVLYTSLADPPAEVVAAIYRLRWSIELFFRFLKQMLGVRQLLSRGDGANAIQVYCALIAGLLMSRVTGGRVGADELRLLTFYLQGWASEAELQAGLARLRARAKKAANTS